MRFASPGILHRGLKPRPFPVEGLNGVAGIDSPGTLEKIGVRVKIPSNFYSDPNLFFMIPMAFFDQAIMLYSIGRHVGVRHCL